MMIKKWHAKALIQKLISLIPKYKHRVNFLFQKHITKGVSFTEDYFHVKFQHAADNYNFIKRQLTNAEPLQHVLEIGTGWYPIIPVGLYLFGVDVIYTYDIAPLTNVERVRSVLKYFIDHRPLIEERYRVTFKEERVNKVIEIIHSSQNDLGQLLSHMGISLLVGNLIKDDLLQNKEIRYVVSNNTLEHIDKKELEDLFNYLHARLSHPAMMSHFIDMSDHYAHMDQSITVYNFLKFSARQWSLINNSVQPMNRLRFRDYIRIAEKSGFMNLYSHVWDYEIKDLERQKIHSDFTENYSTEELAIAHAYLVSQVVSEKFEASYDIG